MTTKTRVVKQSVFIDYCKDMYIHFFNKQDGDLFVSISDDKSEIRSKAQNALMHIYYKVIAEHEGDDVEDIGARCKRKFGLPIMMVQAGEKTKKGNKVYFELLRFGLIKTDSKPEQKRILINYHDLDYIGQLECFKIMQVTRNFNSTEMNKIMVISYKSLSYP